MDPPHSVTEFDPFPLDVHSKLLGVGNRRQRILHAVIEFHFHVPEDLEIKVLSSETSGLTQGPSEPKGSYGLSRSVYCLFICLLFIIIYYYCYIFEGVNNYFRK